MHFAFKFPDAFKVVDCEKRFAASDAQILEALPIVPLSTGGTPKMR